MKLSEMSNVLIIGATSGIGMKLAERLTGNWRIWTASRGPAPAGIEAHINWDASKEPLPAETLPEVLDALVYCPGSIRLQPFHRLTDDAFREDWEINVGGAIRAIRPALGALKAAETSSIVLFSTTAVTTGMPMHASVSAAKGAVEGLTRALAAELAPKIRVNAIAPSLTDTPLSSPLLRTERQREAADKRHPLGHIGKPEDLAALAALLVSQEAKWITGQVIHVDGGIGALRTFS